MSDTPVAAPINLVIGTPCYGGNVSHHYLTSALNLQAACMRMGIGLSFVMLGNDSLIPRARNLVVSQFLDKPEATHLLFIDADIGFTPEQVFALLASSKDVVGGVYPMKRLDWPGIVEQARQGADNLPATALNYVVEFLDPRKIQSTSRFMPVRYIGTGFLMIRRVVLERMAERYPELAFNGMNMTINSELASPNTYGFFDCMIDPETRTYLSEDYAFCKRWRDMDGEIWADLLSKLTHVGQHEFNGDLAAMLMHFSA